MEPRTRIPRSRSRFTVEATALVSIGALLYPFAALAQSERQESELPVEEIVVKGARSLRSLRLDVIKAEDQMFTLFNSLNSNDEFDISCETVAATGTLIKQRVCDVQYMKNARAEAAQDYVHLDNPMPSEIELRDLYSHKREAVNKELAALVAEHPELARAIIETRELRQRYAEQQKAREKNWLFPTLFGGNAEQADD